MPIGILQDSLDPNDLPRSFQLAAQAGAEGIELICAEDEHVAAILSDSGAREVAQLKKEFRLDVPAIALKVLEKGESLFGKPPAASAAAEVIRQAMDAAVVMDVPLLVLPFLGKALIEVEAKLDRVIEALQELAEEAEENGLTLGIECTLNVNQQLHLLTHLGAYTSVKAVYDTANTLARKLDPATFLRDLGAEHVAHVHFRDVRLGEEGRPPDWNVALGEGDVDFPAIANALGAMGYQGWIVLETPAGGDPLEAAKANLKFARDLLERKQQM